MYNLIKATNLTYEHYNNSNNKRLYETEEGDLYQWISMLPQGAATRQLNDLIKRARSVRVHAYTLIYLKEKMPGYFGKAKKQKGMLRDMDKVLADVRQQYRLSPGDLPPVEEAQAALGRLDFSILLI